MKLPVIPSFRRSRRERCRDGPEPIGGKDVGLVLDMLLRIDSVVGLPDDIDTVGLLDLCESNEDAASSDELVTLPPVNADINGVATCLLAFCGMSMNERCFGEQSREDDILIRFFWFYLSANALSETQTTNLTSRTALCWIPSHRSLWCLFNAHFWLKRFLGEFNWLIDLSILINWIDFWRNNWIE